MKTYKGKFRPKNPEKYVGNLDKIIYRSGWERQLMKQFDERSDIIQWASEELAIPYISPLDKQYHRYFPDFIIKARQSDGIESMMMIEVKPFAQTQKPTTKGRKRTSKKFLREVTTYAVNEAKWKTAINYCEKKGWKFVILHEKNTAFI
tara:strand:+ start:2216 stop:2662 length:447 start_codon:yes stop_codon:yes gene_type:complete